MKLRDFVLLIYDELNLQIRNREIDDAVIHDACVRNNEYKVKVSIFKDSREYESIRTYKVERLCKIDVFTTRDLVLCTYHRLKKYIDAKAILDGFVDVEGTKIVTTIFVDEEIEPHDLVEIMASFITPINVKYCI